jgi:hypothetical protein
MAQVQSACFANMKLWVQTPVTTAPPPQKKVSFSFLFLFLQYWKLNPGPHKS